MSVCLCLSLCPSVCLCRQAAYHCVKSAVLDNQLRQLSLNDDKVVILVETWKKSGAEVISGLRHHSLLPTQV